MTAGTGGTRPKLLMLPTSDRDRLISYRQSRRRRSGQLYRPVVVAMIAVRMMQPSTHQIIDVIPMRHGFVPAGQAMLVRAARLRRALHGVGGIDRDDVLIDMILVHVVEMPIVQVVDMAFMAYRRMPTVGIMLVGMVGMMLLGAGCHGVLSFFVCGPSGPRLLPFGTIKRSA
jgi:hypothetical protein